MGYNWKIIRKKIYGILMAPGRGMQTMAMYDENGNESYDPSDSNRFFVTFKSSDPELESYTILVAVRDRGQSSSIDVKTPLISNDADFDTVLNLVNYMKHAVGRREGISINWHDFDKAIDPKEEAVNNISESKDIGKFSGTVKSSYQRVGDARLIIRHTEPVSEDKRGSRTRHIRAIFIENKAGERFAYPFLHLAGARAFARHVSNGGKNGDNIAARLYSLSEDYASLRRATKLLKKHEELMENCHQIREAMHGINRKLKSLHGPKGYRQSSQDLLSENIMEDASMVTEMHMSLASKCGCDPSSQEHADLGVAAKYITGMPRMTDPMVFAWHFRPDMTAVDHDDPKERMYQQIMSLARACANRVTAQKLGNIASGLAAGTAPSHRDVDLIKQALASGLSYIPQEKPILEESELMDFLQEFDPDSIFGKR